MTPAEAAALLAIAAAYDNRKPDPDAAKAWSVALAGLRFEDCRDAIVAHYRTSTDWMMPGHVIAAVKRTRAARLAAAPPLTPPPDLTPLETVAWLRAARRTIANGEPLEDTYGELKPRHLPDLRAIVAAPERTS